MSYYSFFYSLIAENKDLLRFFYSVFIAFVCLVIVIKTDRLFRISYHQGIRYFRNAFFFYGVAFVLRYLLYSPSYSMFISVFFQFFMIMAGFFLLYSLLWKKFEFNKEYKSSFFSPIIFLFYFFTLVIVLLDYFWQTYNFMFFSQIIIFGLASIISFKNYLQKGKKHSFPKFYFIVMILSFFAWSFNFLFVSFFAWKLRWLANVYALNILVFLIFLYGVIKVIKKQN